MYKDVQFSFIYEIVKNWKQLKCGKWLRILQHIHLVEY